MLGMNSGTGKEQENYLQTFYAEAYRITGDDIYRHHQHFIQTVYIHDSIAVIAVSLDHLVREKAFRLNISQESVVVTLRDREALANHLRHLNASIGLTGRISFTESGRREVSMVNLRNFVPNDNINFTVNNSLTEDPWVIQNRACLQVYQKGIVNIVYFDESGNNSQVPSIVFHDGTTNIPLDRPFRVFVRSKRSYNMHITIPLTNYNYYHIIVNYSL